MRLPWVVHSSANHGSNRTSTISLAVWGNSQAYIRCKPLPEGLTYPPGTKVPKAIMLLIKGDWSEHSHTLALSPHSVFWQPCQYCALSKDELHQHNSEITSDMNWPLREQKDYFKAVAMCEKAVLIRHQRDVVHLLQNLKWANPKKSAGGRVITREVTINGVLLKEGDRLEPSDDLPDIAKLSSVRCPCQISFWRSRRDERGRPMDSVNHRCPFFPNGLEARQSLH